MRFTAELWRWSGDAAWHFVTLPVELADDVREAAGEPRGFGSVRVRVTVGATSWRTSLFPSAQEGTYVLPVKGPVRRAEGLEVGEPVEVALELEGGMLPR